MILQKILILKLCCLGDLMQMLPMLGAIRQKYPKAQIDFLASSWVYDILNRLPGIDNILTWDEPYHSNSWTRKLTSAWKMAQILKTQQYDAVLIAHRSALSGMLGRMAQIPRVIGFGSRPFFTDPIPFQAGTHESDRFLALSASIDCNLPALPMELRVLPEDRLAAETLLQENGVVSSSGIICLLPGGGNNPGTRMPIKQWPKEKWAEFIRSLPAPLSSSPLLLLGNTQDAFITSWIKNELAHPTHLIDLAGKTSFPALMGLLAKSRLVVGGDSGPLYIASALGRPALILFGPSDPRIVAPRAPQARYLWKQIFCAPCYTPQTSIDWKRYINGEFPCWTGTHACMKKLPAEEVSATVASMT